MYSFPTRWEKSPFSSTSSISVDLCWQKGAKGRRKEMQLEATSTRCFSDLECHLDFLSFKIRQWHCTQVEEWHSKKSKNPGWRLITSLRVLNLSQISHHRLFVIDQAKQIKKLCAKSRAKIELCKKYLETKLVLETSFR